MAPSPTIRRLLKETQELSAATKHPNPAFHAAPISEDNLHEWHFTLLGPPSPSPYAGGIYHGRITLPPAYPMKPPNFRFLTPSGRFEVNREICLSISGFHEETWQPAWGVRLALTALRGFMGEEGTAGQVGGLESPKEVRERLAKASAAWKCPSCGGDEEGDNLKGWTNEQRMQWWWDICKSKGVNVESEIQGIEALPEGMKLEARDVKQEKGKQPEVTEQIDAKSYHTTSSHNDINQRTPRDQVETSTVPLSFVHESNSYTSEAAGSSPAPEQPSQVPPVPASSSYSTLSQQASQHPQRPTQLHPQPAESLLSVDRAIAAVFLALCVMILKKVFYPSTSGSLFGGYDELRMVRE